MKKETAKAIYNEVPDWMKKVLVDEFGEKTFAKKEYTDIKTLVDAAEATGTPLQDLEERSDETKDEWAYRMMKIIVKAINQKWTPNWDNSNQQKWWPYFKLSSGFGFSDSYYDYVNTGTNVGSRLCFESEEKCNYAATQFLSIYEEFLTVKK